MPDDTIQLTAIEAWLDRNEQIAFTLPLGATLLDAAQYLADQNFGPMLRRFSTDEWGDAKHRNWQELISQHIGVYGKRHQLNNRLRDGDRIEFYRALTIDPKLARSSEVEITRRKERQARDARRLLLKHSKPTLG